MGDNTQMIFKKICRILSPAALKMVNSLDWANPPSPAATAINTINGRSKYKRLGIPDRETQAMSSAV